MSQSPHVYRVNLPLRIFLRVLGVVSLPLFGIGLIVLKVSFQRLTLGADELVIKSLWTKRIPYGNILGVRRLKGREAEGRHGILGLDLVGRKGPYFIPISKFERSGEFGPALAARVGIAYNVRPGAPAEAQATQQQPYQQQQVPAASPAPTGQPWPPPGPVN